MNQQNIGILVLVLETWDHCKMHMFKNTGQQDMRTFPRCLLVLLEDIHMQICYNIALRAKREQILL